MVFGILNGGAYKAGSGEAVCCDQEAFVWEVKMMVCMKWSIRRKFYLCIAKLSLTCATKERNIIVAIFLQSSMFLSDLL